MYVAGLFILFQNKEMGKWGGLQLLLQHCSSITPRASPGCLPAFWLHEYLISWGFELAKHQPALLPLPFQGSAAPLCLAGPPVAEQRTGRSMINDQPGECPQRACHLFLFQAPWRGLEEPGKAQGHGIFPSQSEVRS